MQKDKCTSKRAVWASGLTLLLCLAMLIGTTFAWFTDVVSNKGNRIQAGTLKIQVTGYDKDKSLIGDFANPSTPPIISDANWEPSLTNTKYIKVENKGTLNLEFDLKFLVDFTDPDLREVLLYRFTEISEFGAAEDISPTATQWEDPVITHTFFDFSSEALNKQYLAPGASKLYRLDYLFCYKAGNTYQAQKVDVDIVVAAAQAIVSTDPKIAYVTTKSEFEAVQNGQTAVLLNDIDVGDLAINDKIFNMDLNGYTLTGGDIVFNADGERCSMDIQNGKLIADRFTIHADSAYINVKNTVCADDIFTIHAAGLRDEHAALVR